MVQVWLIGIWAKLCRSWVWTSLLAIFTTACTVWRSNIICNCNNLLPLFYWVSVYWKSLLKMFHQPNNCHVFLSLTALFSFLLKCKIGATLTESVAPVIQSPHYYEVNVCGVMSIQYWTCLERNLTSLIMQWLQNIEIFKIMIKLTSLRRLLIPVWCNKTFQYISTLILYQVNDIFYALIQGSPHLILEGWFPAEFSSNPNQTHLNLLIKVLLGILETSRQVCWGKLELNSAG